MATVDKVFATSCERALLTAINDSGLFPDCIQIINLGTGTTRFEFVSSLTPTQDGDLDSLLSAWGYPVEPSQEEISGFTIDDDVAAGDDVVWSSERVLQEIQQQLTQASTGVDYAEYNGQRSTTSTYWQQALEMQTPDLESGDYLLSWSCEWTNSSTRRFTEVRIDLNNDADDNGDDAIGFYRLEVKEDDGWYSMSGFKQLTLSGVNEIDFDFRRSGNGSSTAYVRRIRLHLGRV